MRSPVRGLMRTSFTLEDVMDVNEEMEDLAAAYMAQKVVPAGYADDAQHVAVCSVARFDYLVSWNFKHLANVRRESGFNAVNVLQVTHLCAWCPQPSLSMATTKKKTFDAVAESRRWRIATGKRLAAITPEERRAHLRSTTRRFLPRSPSAVRPRSRTAKPLPFWLPRSSLPVPVR